MSRSQKSNQVSRSAPAPKQQQTSHGTQERGIELEVLAVEVEQLRLEMERIESTECGHYRALINLRFAEKEARAGNQTKAVSHLKKAGRPALDLAKKMEASAVLAAVDPRLPS